jgi:tetratricopeptide (TPR) repeat protein
MNTISDHIRLLLRLYSQPGAAMSGILDRGSLLFASLTVLIVSLAAQSTAFRFYTPLLLLAVVYVPGTLLIAQWIGAGAAFQRDYSPLLVCASMAWSAANIPLAVAGRLFPASAFMALEVVTYLYFAALMLFAVRTVFGVGNGVAAGAVCLSWIPLVAAFFLWGPLRYIAGWLASPFFLFYAYYYLGGEFTNLGAGFRQRQNFRRMLESSTVNPHDAESRYQLGLIYQERRQYSEAIQQFKAAVAIDPKETDAHFQLGRIALEQGRLSDALACFQTVVEQDEKHHSHEILRELGRMYLAAKQYEDARRELAVYVERREYDPEGLYYYGQALEGLGRIGEACGAYSSAMEAAAAAPYYRRRYTAKWSRLAQKQAGKLRSSKTPNA